MFETVILWLTAHLELIAGLLAAIVAIIEFSSKIKWRPISSILRWLGKGLNSDMYKQIHELDAKVTESLIKSEEMNGHTRKQLEDYYTRLEEFKKDIDENEKDRIKQIIYHYGRIVRCCGEIGIEEFRHIQDVYYKYHEVLKGNGKITEEYQLIVDYFNKATTSN